jgi:hypothetical protein
MIFLPETGAQNEKAPSVSRRGLVNRVPDLLQDARTPKTPPKGFFVFFVRFIVNVMVNGMAARKLT